MKNSHGGRFRRNSPAYIVSTVGIMAATLEAGKLALAVLPNVEVVTLLCAVYGYAFGIWGILATLVFVCIEPIIWGFGSWVISYIIYWPLVAFIFMLLGKRRVKNRLAYTGIAVGLTLFFGFLTTLVDTGLFSGMFEDFWYRFGIMYARGAVFFIIHLISNAVIFFILFSPVCGALYGFSPLRGEHEEQ